MGIKQRLERLEATAEKGGDYAGGYRVPPEVNLVCAMLERARARATGEEVPHYTREEIEELTRQDVEGVEGRGVEALLRGNSGWQSEREQALLDEWQEGARERLERIGAGEDPVVVYERHDEDERKEARGA